ncbi:hypothetical protein HHX47_DHR7000460 [Lentinula edodes]|nr:hypothetical protein HHX47_DHR7000460 [Lentinula edodes]
MVQFTERKRGSVCCVRVVGSECYYQATRYRQVLYKCALEKDLELFQTGDETEVGKKGLTLSRGQKARVTLARVIYSSAEVLLLDDVLAALSVHTSKWIVENCFKGDLVKDRTILLVTHNTFLTHPIAGYVVSLKDGQVAKQGTVAEVLGVSEIEQVVGSSAENVENVETIETIEQIEDEIAGNHDGSGGSNGESDGTKSKKSPPVNGQGKRIVAEEIQIGNVGWPDGLFHTLVGLWLKFPVTVTTVSQLRVQIQRCNFHQSAPK